MKETKKLDFIQEQVKPWSVNDAKDKLSEVLRLAREAGPQFIGKRQPCVLMSLDAFNSLTKPEEPLGLWMLEHSPGIEFETPARGESASRSVPFEELNA